MNKKRQMPPWLTNKMKKNINSKSEIEEKMEIPEIQKRITRSNSGIIKKSDEPEKIKSYAMPFIDYKGKIEYCSTMIDIACACDTLLDYIKKLTAKNKIKAKNMDTENDCSSLNMQSSAVPNNTKIPIAFDMEWPFSFTTGPGRTATIQLCADESLCYVFSIGNLKNLPTALKQLLYQQNVVFHGVNIKNDFRKLERDFPEIKSDTLIEKCVDLGLMCNEIFNTSGRWSLERLVNYICTLQINKDKKVRMSQWNNVPLDENQLLYAAIDVYIGQVIFHKLEQKEKNKTPESIQHQAILKKLNLD